MHPNPFKIYEFIEVVSGSRLKQEHSILDLGCGKGHWTLSLARRCHMAIGVDTSESQIAVARRFARHSPAKDRVQFLCTRLEEANLPATSLDRVFSFCVLEHILNLDRVLAEAVRLLKPGGELHVSVDSLANVKDRPLLAKHKCDHLVVQYFTEDSLQRQLQAAGLEVFEIYPILTSEFARQEFEKRIRRGYKHGLVKRILLYRRFRDEDRHSRSREGIMLVGRARRPVIDGMDIVA
jgi:ubiquinone/menaquinone biosynthesis C-methylase UbiE